MSKQIKVWDPLVRIFHWSLLLFFTLAYFTGEEESSIHIYSGYIVLGLIIFRLIWGLIGSKYARFTQFVCAPKEIISYTKAFLSLSPKHYLGHNPLGGVMVLMLLASLFVVTLSGLKLYAVEEGEGPFAAIDNISLVSNAYADKLYADEDQEDENEGDGNEEGEYFWEDIHEASADFMVFLIFLHIAGVLVSGRIHNENLIKAMITGKKNIDN